MSKENRIFDLEERLIDFAVRIIRIVESLPKTKVANHIAGQLVRCGTSPAPNYGEAQSAESRSDFIHKMKVALKELRETILEIAKDYAPNHDDGVQIAAAPLWPLFQHKPWQKVLKETWKKLEKGDYDWAHLAMNYWPDRVREKCKTDKSLAIAHDLEDLHEG